MSILTELKEFIENKGGDSSDISTIAEAIDAIDQQGISGGSGSGTSTNGVFFIDLIRSSQDFTCNQKWSDIVNAFRNEMALIVRGSILLTNDDQEVTGKHETYFNYVEIESNNGIPESIDARAISFLPQDESLFQCDQINIYITEGDNDNVDVNIDDSLTFQTVFQGLSS